MWLRFAKLHRGRQHANASHPDVRQFAAKQYSRPSPPVLFRSACEQPPSGPREGCDEFQDFEASSSRRPMRSICPSMAEPCVELVQFLQVRSSPAANARSEEHTSELQSHVNLVC